MKTHLLLSHLENDLHCPLCLLSCMSCDELCFHFSSVHPEKRHRVAHFTSSSDCSVPTSTGETECEKRQASPNVLSQSFLTGYSCDTACEASPTGASSVTTDSLPCKQSSTPQSGGSTPGETAFITSPLTTQSAKGRQESIRHSNEDNIGIKSEYNKAKQKQLSLPREGD